jgi:hypothetical protein
VKGENPPRRAGSRRSAGPKHYCLVSENSQPGAAAYLLAGAPFAMGGPGVTPRLRPWESFTAAVGSGSPEATRKPVFSPYPRRCYACDSRNTLPPPPGLQAAKPGDVFLLCCHECCHPPRFAGVLGSWRLRPTPVFPQLDDGGNTLRVDSDDCGSSYRLRRARSISSAPRPSSASLAC